MRTRNVSTAEVKAAGGRLDPSYYLQDGQPMTVLQAAARLGVSRRRVRQLMEDGRLSSFRLASRTLLDKGSVERLASQPRPAGRPHKEQA